MAEGYRRVSKKRPCQICFKPDWCSTTADADISFCARSTTYADRISPDGWGVYYRNFNRSADPCNPRSSRKRRYSKSTSIAPIEFRDAVYRTLIQLSPIGKTGTSNPDERMATGQEIDHSRYGLYPSAARNRHRLAATIAELCGNSNDRSTSLKGVPGFWRGSNGRPRLGSDFDYDADLLLIPFLDSNGLIQACQLKAIGKAKSTSGKYKWLSSIGKREGCGSGTPLHHEGSVGFGGKTSKTVLVTEGVLKAAAAHHFLPDRYVVANGGVATSHQEIVKVARQKTLEIAFDADCFTNPHVARALASLLALRIREQLFLSCDKPTKILAWDRRFKGIDDALIAGASIKYLEVSDWLGSLTPECFDEASHQLGRISL